MTCFYIADKFFSKFHLNLIVCNELCLNNFDEYKFVEVERLILNSLDYRLSCPTTNFFLCSFLNVLKIEGCIKAMTVYLCEISLIEYEFINCYPLFIATGIMILSLYTFDKNYWSEKLEYFSGLNLISDQLQYCVDLLYTKMNLSLKNYKSQTFQKYSLGKYSNISIHIITKKKPILKNYNPFF